MRLRGTMLRFNTIVSLLLLVILLMAALYHPIDTIAGVNKHPLILANTNNNTVRTLDTQAQQDIIDGFLAIMQENKPIGKELVLVQFENLSNAVYSYDSTKQLVEIGKLTETLTPLVLYSTIQALAETSEVGEVLANSVEAEEEKEIEALEDASNDDAESILYSRTNDSNR